MALYFPKIRKYTLFPDYWKIKLKKLWGKYSATLFYYFLINLGPLGALMKSKIIFDVTKPIVGLIQYAFKRSQLLSQ